MKALTQPGGIVTYTVTLTVPAMLPSSTEYNVIFKDVIPQGATFKSGTFKVNTSTIFTANPNIGVNLGDLPSGTTTTIQYSVIVDNPLTKTMFTDTAQVTSQPSPTAPPVIYSSNPFTVRVGALSVVKSANKTTAALGEIIGFTIVVKNTGEVPLTGLVLSDVLPQWLQLAPNSVYINGSLISSPDIGKLPLPGMLPDAVTIVIFSAKVICAPCNLIIANSATVSGFIVAQPPIPIYQTSNTVVVITANPSFKQLNREEYVTIPAQKPDMEEILNTLVDIEIINTKVIKTIEGTSNEGQTLTGFKLIIEGTLNEKVEYIASNAEQSVHAAHFRIPFSTFIILPPDFIEGTLIKVEAVVEDIYAKKVDRRTIFKNITFKLNAQFS